MNAAERRKKEDSKRTLRQLEILLELLVLLVIYYYTWKYFYRSILAFPYYGWGKVIMILIYAALAVIIIRLNDGFMFGYHKMMEVVISQWVALFIVNIITYFQLCLMANRLLPPKGMLFIMLFDLVASFFFIAVFTLIYQRQDNRLRFLIISGKPDGEALRIKSKIINGNGRYIVEEIVPSDISDDELKEKISKYDAVIITDVPAERRNDILKYTYANEIRTYVSPKLSDIIESGGEGIYLFDTPLRLVKGQGISLGNRFVKRLFDIILSFIALVVLSPLFLVIAIAIKACDKGPILYRQERVTRDGKVFVLLKFRSMIIAAENDNVARLAKEQDSRITKVGRFIRKTRMDELPQLINIIKGDMSIVGPRPERPELVEEYLKDIPEFSYRLKVKGGLTGYAQVYGRYNTGAIDKLKYDLMYIENFSIALDFKIMLLTVGTLFKKEATEGVSDGGS